MNYTQTLEFLFQSLPVFETQGATAYEPGCERITAFCRHIGNPQRNFFTIHVAGTNGKGSVAHVIASVLQQAGYRTGLFASPPPPGFPRTHPRRRRDDASRRWSTSWTSTTTRSSNWNWSLRDDRRNGLRLLRPKRRRGGGDRNGTGGRLDATNIIVPILSVITNIGLEHTSLLGDTLPKIAAEKAGIVQKRASR